MQILRTPHTLTALALVLASLAGCRGWTSDQPPVHVVLNMDTQEKGKAYAPSELFADRRMMRTPPAGTVARGFLQEDDHSVLGVVDGKAATAWPTSFAVNDASFARGKERYGIYCAPCHGQQLDGKGEVAKPGRLQVPPPAFLGNERLESMPVGQIYGAIRNGVNQGNMGSYAAQIPEQDRWNIAYFVRKSQMANNPSLTEGGREVVAVVVTAASADAGKALYASKGCNACHSLDGTKVVGPSFKGLWGKKEATDKGDVDVNLDYIKESILMPNAKVVKDFAPIMPAMPLTDLEVESVAKFIETLK